MASVGSNYAGLRLPPPIVPNTKYKNRTKEVLNILKVNHIDDLNNSQLSSLVSVYIYNNSLYEGLYSTVLEVVDGAYKYLPEYASEGEEYKKIYDDIVNGGLNWSSEEIDCFQNTLEKFNKQEEDMSCNAEAFMSNREKLTRKNICKAAIYTKYCYHRLE